MSNGSCQSNKLLCAKGFGEVLYGFSFDEQFCSEAPFTSCEGFCSGCDRYIQAPLAYPKERERRMNGGEEWLPLCIYDSEKGGLIGGPLQCYWSEYYSSHSREPENTELAPWVADLYHPVSAS